MKFLLALFLIPASLGAGAPTSHDIVVYGGTSGGVTAAVQAARSGKSVVLISPLAHLGGMTTSGLGWTDLGNPAILGGLSREFYHRIYHYYQEESAWVWQDRESYQNVGQGAHAFDSRTELAAVFEPKVAEKIFLELLAEAGVAVVTGSLNWRDGVIAREGKILRLKLADGSEYSGKIFIDASYEGDLLPGAGVTFHVGREANETYGETINGVQMGRAVYHQFPDGVDPHVIPGDPASGLLPGIEPGPPEADGRADSRVQAFCFRMVLTDVAANRVRVERPDGYDERDYELLFRALEAGMKANFFKLDLMPNRKTDSNNTGPLSTDMIGRNHGPGWDWTTLDHAGRTALAKEHENWQRGLLWTIQNHPRVPEPIRKRYAKWGLAADEFTDNAHWPWQIYVREGRRMVSDYVMSQANCDGVLYAADSVGLAAYTMDSHHVRRLVTRGMVKNEGDVQVRTQGPYPVSYRSLVPRRGECENLLVPWALSASHMAFGSIRMEPVFMTLAQSAAIAGAYAIDHETAVQDVPYEDLRPLLLEVGQALGEPASERPAVVIDNADHAHVTITGAWESSRAIRGFAGRDYLHRQATGEEGAEVFYQVPEAATGRREVFLRWTAHENRAPKVQVEIRHSGGTEVVSVNQRERGGQWNSLSTHSFTGAPGEGVSILAAGAEGQVIADAVGFSPALEEEDPKK